MKMSEWWRANGFWTRIGMVGFILLTVGLGVPSAVALPVTTPDPDDRCLTEVQVRRFTVAPATVDFGQSVTFSWDVLAPTGCTTLKFYLESVPIPRQGNLTVHPICTATYDLRAELPNYGVSTIASTSVNVQVPPVVTINSSDQERLLRAALCVPHTTIYVANQVDLDLSNLESIRVAEGVTLIGGRNAREAGPRLYTTSRPRVLLLIQGDNVRISGLRIQGPEMGIGDGDDNLSRGIAINSNVNIQIDNNEIYGWSGAAVQVHDDGARLDYVFNPGTVRVHDNYIHHNQHYAKWGYGVRVGHGAYALIERNVFDWNRHAIATDGSNGSGYRAYKNLVLKNGGYHRWWPWPVGWQHTHQFDVHGQDNCGIADLFSDAAYNCGPAGHDFEVRYNSFLYTAGAAFKLRGVPELTPYGAFVISNVFAHPLSFQAIQQTDWASGLYTANNVFGVDGSDEEAMCDFDGDGIADRFLATGKTWWYSSGGQMHWVYLNTSDKRLHEVTLGYFDGDNRCDVVAGSLISSGGTGAWRPFISPGIAPSVSAPSLVK